MFDIISIRTKHESPLMRGCAAIDVEREYENQPSKYIQYYNSILYAPIKAIGSLNIEYINHIFDREQLGFSVCIRKIKGKIKEKMKKKRFFYDSISS